MRRGVCQSHGAGALLVIVLVLSSCPAVGQLMAEQKKSNLESFDYVWSTIRDKHFDTTFGGVNWQAVRDELRPKVEAATSANEVRAVLREMISRLGLSHFNVIPSQVYENIEAPRRKGDQGGTTGIRVRVLENRAIVTRVDAGIPAAEAGVKSGWEILKIDGADIPPLLPPIAEAFAGKPQKDYTLASAVAARLTGGIGDSVTVVFLDGSNQEVEKRLPLAEPLGKRVVLGNLPPLYLTTKVDTLEGNIGYIAFSAFVDPVSLMAVFGEAMQSFMKCPGVIIDVRGNPGGIGGLAMGMAGWLVAEKNLYMGTLSTREASLKFVVNPRAEVYEAPVAVLVDGLSGSTSEIFAGGLQDMGRARVFGSRTAGAALPSLFEKLPNGDGFQYAFAKYVSKSGRVLEGNGVIPDVEVQPTRDTLLQGRDPVIQAAVEWITSQAPKKE